MTAPLSSAQVCRLAGVTYRQLDYWARTGVVTPSVNKGLGTGGQGRRWSAEDVRRVRLVALLMRWSASSLGNPMMKIVRRVVQAFDEMPTDEGYLVVGATASVSWAACGTELAEACRRNGSGCWVVDLGALAAERRAS